MRISVDAMGGDNAPAAVVEGCIEAMKELDVHITFVGPKNIVEKELQKYQYDSKKVTVVDATEVITPSEHPVMAIRKKKNSSICVALNLVKNQQCDAVISAGSTGAFLAGSLFIVGRIKGVDRPALAPIMPGKNGSFMVIDAGANTDCKPENLLQFGIMGQIYMKDVMGIENPSVGLINIGAEEEKGNELTKSTYKLLKESKINFAGNIEPRDVSAGDVEVLVCDGFVGNTVLKMYEGVASNIFDILKNEMMSSFRTKMGALILKPMFKRFKKKFDYKEVGGAPFLGVNGICIKAHGSSDARAFKNAVKQTVLLHEKNVIEKIKESITNNLTE